MRRLTTALALLLALSATARADWPAGGKKIMDIFNSFNGVRRVFFLDHPSGDLIVIGVGKGNSTHVPTAQRISPAGDLSPLWPAAGIGFGGILPPHGLSEYTGFAVDDSGNVWSSWTATSSSIWNGTNADILSADGILTSGLAVGTTGKDEASDVAIGPGGDMYVMCGSTRLQRFTRSGTVAPGWPATGVVVPGSTGFDAEVRPDGTGGAITFVHAVLTNPTVTRFDANGLRHAGWPAGGLGLTTVPGYLTSEDLLDNLFPSGPDHFLAVWTQVGDPTNGKQTILVQRFGLDGTLDPAWPATGIAAVPPDTIACASAIADGSGGVYVVWEAHGAPFAKHIGGDGSVIGGANGISVLDANAAYRSQFGIFFGRGGENMIADRTPDGGLLVAWDDNRLAPTASFRLRWLRSDLTPAVGKPDTGLVVFPTVQDLGALRAIRTDGPDGAYIAFSNRHGGTGMDSEGEVWLTHVIAPATLGVPPRAGRAPITLSAPRPNPARGAFAIDVTLADDSPVRVELLDVAGRIVRTQQLRGAGAHVVQFDGLGTLEPGLYFVRASTGEGSRGTRFALMR